MSKGTLFIVSAPSGAGKSSLLHAALIENRDDLQLSVSHTTRPPRPGEEDGLHYNFTTVEQFEQDIENDQFLEYAKVFDNYYGTSEIWCPTGTQEDPRGDLHLHPAPLSSGLERAFEWARSGQRGRDRAPPAGCRC